MVEHNRSFLEQIYITNPSQYSTNPEQVGPSIGEKAAQKGNEEFDRLLDEFVNISESVLSKEEKIRQLNELSLQISAEQNRRNKQQLRPDNGEESTKKELMQAVDFDPILQMIDGEMRTLQEGGKEPPKSEEKKSDLEYLKDKVDVVKEQIDSGSIDFSNIDTFEKILKLLEQGLEKIESNVSLAGDVNLVTRQGEVDALRKSINELRIAFIQKWKENNPVLQAFITRFDEVSKKVKDAIANNKRGITLTTHFAELESEFKALEQERGKLPKEYQDALAEYVTNRNALKESVVKSWLEWADSDPKSRFAALRTFIEDKRKAHIVGNDVINQAVLDEVSAAQASWKDYKTQAPHFDEQLAYIDERIAELTQLSEELKNKNSSIENKEKRVRELRDEITAIEQDPPVTLEANLDKLSSLLDKVKAKLESLKELLSEEEYSLLEQEVWKFEFRYIKRVIDAQVRADVINASNHTSYVGKTYEVLFKEKLNRIESRINDFRRKGLTETADIMSADFNRFKSDFTARRLFFYAGAQLEPVIVGKLDPGAGAVRSIPLQTTDWFPNTDNIISTFRPSSPVTTEASLRFAEEKPYNAELPRRNYLIPNFEKPGEFIPNPEYQPSVHGDCKRVFDMMSRNRLHLRLKSKIRQDGRNATPEEQKVISQAEDLFKTLHLGEVNQNVFPQVLMGALKILYGHEITLDEARTNWYEHILFLHHSMMLPGSPNTDDKNYKIFQAPKYIAEGALTGTTPASPFHTACIAGVYNEDYKDEGGAAFVLDRFVVRPESLSKPKSIPEKIGTRLSGVVLEKGKSANREKVYHALEEAGLAEEYGFLADLPFLVIHPSVWGTVPFVPSPLQYLLFKDPGGKRYSASKDPKEVPVLRWGGVSDKELAEGAIPRPITGADFVTPVEYWDDKGNKLVDYDILYEMIPLEQALETTTLDKWYNNGKNIENLRELMYNPSGEKVFDPTEVSIMQNQAKYIATFLPDAIGTNVSAGTFSGERTFQRFTVVSVFARCVDLLTSKDLHLHDVEKKLISLIRVLGQGKKDSRAIEAIVISLKQLLGTQETAEENAQLMLDQVLNALKVR